MLLLLPLSVKLPVSLSMDNIASRSKETEKKANIGELMRFPNDNGVPVASPSRNGRLDEEMCNEERQNSGGIPKSQMRSQDSLLGAYI